MFVSDRSDNVESIVVKYLHLLDSPIEPNEVVAELAKHPDYPSVLAISDVMSFFGKSISAIKVDFSSLPNLKPPYIVHTAHGKYAIVVNDDNSNFVLSDNGTTNYTLSGHEFEKIYSRVVLIGQIPEVAIPKRSWAPTWWNNTQSPLLLTFVILMLASSTNFFYYANFSLPHLSLIFCKVVGVFLSILLLIQSIDKDNELVQKICTSVKVNVDCNGILSSKAAKIFGLISWSEVGFIYFVSSYLCLLFKATSDNFVTAIALLNTCSLLFTLYSLYYQMWIAKKWCILCCAILVVIWFEAGCFYTIFHFEKNTIKFQIDLQFILSVITYCLLPIVVWFSLKPILEKSQKFQVVKDELRVTKYDCQIFRTLLNEQVIASIPDAQWSLNLGSSDAGNIFTVVTNPYCSPCSSIHLEIDKLLRFRTDVQFRIVFSVKNNNSDPATKIANHLMAINNSNDDQLLSNALNDWYNHRYSTAQEWEVAYPITITDNVKSQLNSQAQWCEEAMIVSTPTVFLNGHKLPKTYRLNDLTYLI